MYYNLDDTICAQSTPGGRGGIHVIRISGHDGLSLTSQCFKPFETLDSIESHRVYYGYFVNPLSETRLDEVLVTYFKHGQSFTGEMTVEISCHGNPVIVKNILETLIHLGCRMAEKGEFSYRAFKNGRISASQAEALLSVIESNTNSKISKSLNLLQGDTHNNLKVIEDELIWLISRLEAKIDFSTEDIEIVPFDELLNKVELIIDQIKQSLKYYKTQSIIDKGIKTLILGSPNVGKSSLFNYLIGHQRSIVSSIAGTTRDYISETINIRGKNFEVIDTAGLRYSDDEIETQGISKINELIHISDLILLLFSPENQDLDFLETMDPAWRSKKLIVSVNKTDLMKDVNFKINLMAHFNNLDSNQPISAQMISVKDQSGLEALMDQMSMMFDLDLETDPLGIVSLRQSEELATVLNEMLEAELNLKSDLGDELVLFHLNRAMKSLLSVFHIDDDEIIRDRIFKDFCLGK